MKEEQFEKLEQFFKDNDLEIISNEHCHKCDNTHVSTLSWDWLFDRLVDEKALNDIELRVK